MGVALKSLVPGIQAYEEANMEQAFSLITAGRTSLDIAGFVKNVTAGLEGGLVYTQAHMFSTEAAFWVA